MGLYIIDHSSVINDEINQRIEELSDSANEKLAKTEQDAVYVKPHLVLDPDLPAQDIINAVAELF